MLLHDSIKSMAWVKIGTKLIKFTQKCVNICLQFWTLCKNSQKSTVQFQKEFHESKNKGVSTSDFEKMYEKGGRRVPPLIYLIYSH